MSILLFVVLKKEGEANNLLQIVSITATAINHSGNIYSTLSPLLPYFDWHWKQLDCFRDKTVIGTFYCVCVFSKGIRFSLMYQRGTQILKGNKYHLKSLKESRSKRSHRIQIVIKE